MKHVLRIFAFAASVSLLALPGCSNPADGKPVAEVKDTAPVAAASGEGTLHNFTEESTITWVASKVTGSHDGGFGNFDGSIIVAPDRKAESSTVSIQIDTTSLFSDTEKLTGHLKSADFFDVEAYPMASFESTAIAKTAEGYSVTGNLNMHGVTKSITFPAKIEIDEAGVRALAEFSIKRFDWNIAYKGKADDLIRDEVVIRFDLAATPEA